MPIFNDDSMEQLKGGSGFQFSAINLQKLGASEYTLVVLAVDTSGSLGGFDAQLEACLKTTLEGCQKSPRVDNLLVRVVTFATGMNELHGFRPLADCHLGAYDGCIRTGGTTCLYDTATSAVDSVATYGKQLMDQDYMVNAIVCILTDGQDVGSTMSVRNVQEALARALKSECLESLVSILIGFNITDARVGKALAEFQGDAGIGQYLEAPDATPKTFAKIAGFISKSVSSQSQSLGSGGASQPIQVTF